MRRSRRVLVVASTILGSAALAHGQAASDPPADAPVLHEYVAPPKAGGGAGAGGDAEAPRTFGGSPRAGKNPAAVKTDDKLLPEPPKDLTPGQKEPVHGTNQFGADRDTSARLDNQTGADGTLKYVEVFNPAIVPFKRMSVLDAVGDDYVLRVADQRLTELPVGGKTRADRDVFWGSLLIELEPGVEVPIPSTAPDMRILSWEIEPPLDRVAFLKDGADNYFVRADDPGARGTYRLVFLSDSSASYFAPEVPKGYRVSDAAASGLLRPMGDKVRADAAKMHKQLGVSRDMPLDEALDKLIAWFRAFEAGAPPPDTGNTYLDLAQSQRGVCRHRSFAFVITANALGIPARYVTNEAHAFAEVWVPERGWLRVDLGGAALNLDVSNAGDKQMHRPRADDPFPKPPEYADNYTNLRGDVQGLTPDQIAQRQGQGQGRGQGQDPGQRDPGSLDPLAPTPGTGLPAPPPQDYIGKTPLVISVESVDAAGFRGESVRVGGVLVDDDGKPMAGMPVNIYFAPAGRSGDGARRLGGAITGADGRYSVAIDLPRDLALGKHEVFASTPGDKTHQPALSK